MQVFAFFDVDKPHPLVRLWVKSWRARGFKPRLLLKGEQEIKGRRASLSTLNFSFRPRDKRPKTTEWPDTSGNLVSFPAGATEETVLSCWRPDAD